MSTGIARVYDLIEDSVLSEMDIGELNELDCEILETLDGAMRLLKRIGKEQRERQNEDRP